MRACEGRYRWTVAVLTGKTAFVPVRPYGTWPGAIGSDVVARAGGRNFSAVALDADPRALGRDAAGRGRPRRRRRVASRRSDDRRDAGRDQRADASPRVRRRCGLVPRRHRLLLRVRGRTRLPARRRRRRASPITPMPAEPHALRYADGMVTPDGSAVVCVRERHEAGEVHNELVLFPADGSAEPRVIAAGPRLLHGAAPRPGRPAARLARLGPPAHAVGRHGAVDGGARRRGARRAAARRRRPGGVGDRPAILPGRRAPLLLRPKRPVEPLPGERPADAARRCRDRLPGVGLRDEPLCLPRRRPDRLRRHA